MHKEKDLEVLDQQANKNMEKQKILNKYSKPEDKLLIAKMLDKMELALSKNKIEYTDFLDSYQSHLLEKILKQENFSHYLMCGGTENTQRNIIVFYPEKLNTVIMQQDTKILPIVCIRIELPKEMHGVYSHRDYLGGLIKLGIKREKIGDIFVFENGADILVLQEIANFLMNNMGCLTRFSKAKIEIIERNKIRPKSIHKEKMHIIVASMRLDCVISEILKTSRRKSEEILKEGKVFVNFEPNDKLTKQIKEKDCITIRGTGRFEIEQIEGVTKSNRIKLLVGKFI